MSLKNLQKNLTNADQFYKAFINSPEGQAVLDSSQKLFPDANHISIENQKSQEYVFSHLTTWLLDYLSDDEMESGLTWVEKMEPHLKIMIYSSLSSLENV